MKATTHTEIYRPYRGQPVERAFRFLALARTSIRTAAKPKIPLAILLAPPWMAGVVFSFVVYARFAAEAGMTPDALGGGSPAAALVAGFAERLVKVREQIVFFHIAMNAFVLLLIAWYGAGQIAEDRRLGAHLLYFSRPLTLFDYLFGKLLATAWFGALGVLLPSVLIVGVAAFSSPDWSFVKQEGMVIPKTIAFSLLWVGTWSSVILAISSLCARKTVALVAGVGFFVLPGAVSVLLINLLHDRRWNLACLQGNFLRIAGWLFDMPKIGGEGHVAEAFAIVAAVVALSWVVLVVRARRMEAVA